MTLHDYVDVLRRRGWVVLIAALLGVAAAVLVTITATPTYTVRTTLLVSASGDGSPGALQQASSFSNERAVTYAELATSNVTLARAAQAIEGDVDALGEGISATSRTGTSLIDVDASSSDGAEAALRSNAVAEALAVEAVLLDAPSPSSSVDLTVVTPGTVPDLPTSPRPRNNLLVGGVAGLAAGVVLLVVQQTLDTRMRSAADLPAGFAPITVTSLPRARRGDGRKRTSAEPRQEAFRNLRAGLEFGAHARVMAVAGVTSGSRTARVAEQLSQVLAETGLTVVLVDVELRAEGGRRRSDEESLSAPGVTDLITGRATLQDVVREEAESTVSRIGSGQLSSSSAQLLSNGRFAEALAVLQQRFDYVVLACGPVVERSEAVVAAALAGHCLLVVQAGATTQQQLLYADELLSAVGVTSVSAALDGARQPRFGGGRTANRDAAGRLAGVAS